MSPPTHTHSPGCAAHAYLHSSPNRLYNRLSSAYIVSVCSRLAVCVCMCECMQVSGDAVGEVRLCVCICVGNLDRHHYYTFEYFGNFTAPVLTDNGRGSVVVTSTRSNEYPHRCAANIHS